MKRNEEKLSMKKNSAKTYTTTKKTMYLKKTNKQNNNIY